MTDTNVLDLKNKIREEEKKGNIVVLNEEGLMTISLDEILKQPVEGLLYDLNRDTLTIMTFIDDPKWINDYAMAMVVKKLYEENEKLKKQLTNK